MKTIINVLNIKKQITYRGKLMEKAICLVLFPQLLLLVVRISSSALAHRTLINSVLFLFFSSAPKTSLFIFPLLLWRLCGEFFLAWSGCG